MKFFATSEAYKTVSSKLMTAQNVIEKKIISLINEKNYGNDVTFWGYISISNPSKLYDAGFFKEIKKYSKKKKEVECRLRIDYDKMIKADEKEALRLVCESILRSVDIAEKELKIKNFDFTVFRDDLLTLFRREHWIL